MIKKIKYNKTSLLLLYPRNKKKGRKKVNTEKNIKIEAKKMNKEKET